MKRPALTLILAGLLTVHISATGVPEPSVVDSNAREVVDISVTALTGPTGVGVARLINSGPTVAGSARISVSLVPEPPLMVARLASGETDIGMLPSNVAAQLAARGIPVQIAGVSLWGVLYVVSSDPSIDDWGDLRGRTFHSLAQGANPDVIARHLMTLSGIEPDGEVDMRYGFGHAEIAQLLIAGEIETAILPEPLVTQVLSRSDALSIVIDVQEDWAAAYGDRYPQTAIVVRTDAVERSPAAIADALETIERAWAESLADPVATGRASEQAGLGIPAALITQALPRFNVDYRTAIEARAELDRYFTILYAANPRDVGGAVPGDSLYYRGR